MFLSAITEIMITLLKHIEHLMTVNEMIGYLSYFYGLVLMPSTQSPSTPVHSSTDAPEEPGPQILKRNI